MTSAEPQDLRDDVEMAQRDERLQAVAPADRHAASTTTIAKPENIAPTTK